MPCTMTGSLEGDRALAAQENVTELTQLLCSICSELDLEDLEQNKAVFDWYQKHKKVDDAQTPFEKLSEVDQHIVGMISNVLDYAFTYHSDDRYGITLTEIAMEVLDDVKSDLIEIVKES